MTQLSLSLLRHGQSELLSGDHRIRGRLDDPLTALGWSQMNAAVAAARDAAQWQAVISSPLVRCADFAKAMAEKYQLPLVVMPEFAELDFGDWEGKLTADLYAQFADELAKFWQTPTQFTPPNAERIVDFAKRIDDALAQVARLAKQSHWQNVCIVTHGGVIKYLHCLADGAPLDEILLQPAALGQLHHFIWQNGVLRADDSLTNHKPVNLPTADLSRQ